MVRHQSNALDVTFGVGVPRRRSTIWGTYRTPYEAFRYNENYFYLYLIQTDNDSVARAAAAAAGTTFTPSYANGCTEEVTSIIVPFDHL